MNVSRAMKLIKENGFKWAWEQHKKKSTPVLGNHINILLLTNRDSDNVGDQVIEACDISLLSAVMENLNQHCKINSRAASIVSATYVQKKDPALLKKAEELIEKSDVVIFGGAPMFNYLYQIFYERTAVTLEIAKKYNKPVLFSAIGIEGYGENNKKCQRLKKTLNFDCVKQITTRDDFDSLQKYKENEHLVIDKVADPAVFASTVFKKSKAAKKKKTIGIFILRQNGFVDNKIPFSRHEAATLWVDLIRELDAKGYSCELLTSGHFGDEAFLDYLIREYNVSAGKCVFNMNTPEMLIEKISSYEAVISCRLHPSIISFALNVPSLGIVWNPKVRGFYSSIGYEDRVIETEGISAAAIIEKLEQAISEGIKKDEDFLMSVYNTLFYGMKHALNLSDSRQPYTYSELLQKLPAYSGTSPKEGEEKLKRKFRRTYKTYNDRFERNESQKEKIAQLEAEIQRLKETR